MIMKIQFYGTDGSVERRPPQGGSVPHKLLSNIKELRDKNLGDIVELSFEVTNPNYLKPGDPEIKKLYLPLEKYANLQTPQTGVYDIFRLKTTKSGPGNYTQKQDTKFYVGLDIKG